MPKIYDDEFGDITVRRSMRTSNVRISVAPNGTLRASMPRYTPLFILRRFIKSSRPNLRKMLAQQEPAYKLRNGMTIGKSHRLTVIEDAPKTSVKRVGQTILVHLASGAALTDATIEKEVRNVVQAALRLEAKSHLPKRLSYLAERNHCSYEKVRFSHASGRWGSCNSHGTISLNIALMKLPFELIDYVIIHELCHTKQMNHSPRFWALVETADPEYKLHRKQLKSYSPTI
tara:strand:- start:3502 stop:4194 length:693 start_codon:yes stop_codon:yes gene_type:complete